MLRAHRRDSQRCMKSCGRVASAAHERRGTMTCDARAEGQCCLTLTVFWEGTDEGRASEIKPGSQ